MKTLANSKVAQWSFGSLSLRHLLGAEVGMVTKIKLKIGSVESSL